MLSSSITLQFRETQNPFTVRLNTVTVDTVESMGLGEFINSDTITADSRAIKGNCRCSYMDTVIIGLTII